MRGFRWHVALLYDHCGVGISSRTDNGSLRSSFEIDVLIRTNLTCYWHICSSLPVDYGVMGHSCQIWWNEMSVFVFTVSCFRCWDRSRGSKKRVWGGMHCNMREGSWLNNLCAEDDKMSYNCTWCNWCHCWHRCDAVWCTIISLPIRVMLFTAGWFQYRGHLFPSA